MRQKIECICCLHIQNEESWDPFIMTEKDEHIDQCLLKLVQIGIFLARPLFLP